MNFITIERRDALAALDDVRVPMALRRETAADLVAALIDFLDDTEGDWDLEPSLGFDEPEGGDILDEPHDPTDDDEPSLGASEPAFAGGDYHAQQRLIFSAAVPYGSQVSWGLGGSRTELEDEHDGTELENEHGPSWAEGPGRRGRLFSGSDEGDEPSLSLTEHVNQATRTIETTNDWPVEDGEADYARDFGPTNRAMLADAEPDVTDHEDDGMSRGEEDPGERDSGERIIGGGYHL